MRPWAFLPLLVLAGCSGVPERPMPADPQAEFARHRTRLVELDQWRLQARAAVRQGEEGGTVDLQWSQGPTTYSLDLSGPFGSGHLRLSGDDSGARLQRGGEVLEAESAETLLEATLGWSVPVPALRRWVIGLPGGSVDYRIDEYGRLAQLRDGPWSVVYQQYRPVDGLELPARLVLERRDLSIRLAISDWQTSLTRPAAGQPAPVSRRYWP